MADEIDLIRTRINILDLVSQRTALKKAGRSFKALCPFHDDRNPSMTVNPELGRYKCWSCGASGDIFNWVMETQKVDFPEALRLLADQAGVELKAGKRDSGESKSQKAAQEEIMRAAQSFFVKQLQLSAFAKTYSAQRGLTDEVLEAWGIGYSPDEGSALAVTLKKQGFSLALAQELFLVRDDGSGGYYDMFRGRLMIPIADERGRIVAFGGRIIGAGQPKYINSSDTPIYHKSDLLFGMDKAKEAISKKGHAVLVEGYMDVIACHRAGMNEAVASLGTALTPQQVRLMKRWASQVVVLYDRDEAGQKAAEKACEMIAEEGMIARVALPPPGQDPDTLLVEKGAAGVLALLDQAVSPIRHRLIRLDERMKPTDPGYWDEAADALASARNPLELEEHLAPLAALLPNAADKTSAMSALRKMAANARRNRRDPNHRPSLEPTPDPMRGEREVLRLTPAQLWCEGAILRALLVPSYTGMAHNLLREDGLFRPGTAERAARAILEAYPEKAPQGPPSQWIHAIKDQAVIDLLMDLSVMQATGEHHQAADALSGINPQTIEAAIVKLRQLRVSRVLEGAKSRGAFAGSGDDLDEKLALLRDQLRRKAGVEPNEST